MLDREESWLRFNQRVLEEALDPGNPLLERVRFLTIFHTNLDEFFMIRVSGLKQQVEAGVEVLSSSGRSPKQRLQVVHQAIQRDLATASACLTEIRAALADISVRIVSWDELDAPEQKRFRQLFVDNVHPILTPLAISPAFPFPFISNLSINLAVFVRNPAGERRLVRIKVPDHLPRFVLVGEHADPDAVPQVLLPIEALIAANLETLFPGMTVGQPFVFRVTRDADIEIREDEADDLLQFIEEELRKRRFGSAARLEIDADAPDDMVEQLREGLDLSASDVYRMATLIDPSGLSRVCDIDLPEHKFAPFAPRLPKEMEAESIFERIGQGDVLVHHPFDAFVPVAEFVRAAERDPAVLAIKQTLYRTSGNSPVIQALLEAVAAGKQVAAVVELKARFDEENNIGWARRLEEAGVHVIYGVPGLKTHAKICLVVRREGGRLRRYAHVGTGNYNPITARIYTDLGLFTCDPDITADLADLFNRITGFAKPAGYRKVLVAPRFMKTRLIEAIRREIAAAQAGRPARIIAKCNAVIDVDIIEALYEASQAGVSIDLLVRGICGVLPGRDGLSENIRVRSVVGRFLEHSRVLWFHNDGSPRAYIGSADLMGRNLDRRVEILVPVEDPRHRAWIFEVYLARYLADRGRTREMNPDGSYRRLRDDGGDTPDVHRQFLED
jgi:polyphosphate kinase